MSREQWGSGYYKGYDDGKENRGKHKWFAFLDKDGLINECGEILEKRSDGSATIESFEYIELCLLLNTGRTPSWEPHVLEYVRGISPEEFAHAVIYSNILPLMRDFVYSEKKRDEREKSLQKAREIFGNRIVV